MKSWKSIFPRSKRFYETENGILYNADCISLLYKFPEKSINHVICSLPIDEKNKWKSSISVNMMWKRIKNLRTRGANIVFILPEPLATVIRMSNQDEYKYDCYWKKQQGTNPLNVNIRPLNVIENILIFYDTFKVYNPIYKKGTPYKGYCDPTKKIDRFNDAISMHRDNPNGKRHPTNIMEYSNERKNRLHPYQKPLELMKELIKTYTNEDDIVLDFACGSGTTLVACEQLNRRWIGIEIEEGYCDITKDRLEDVVNKKHRRKKK